MREQDPRISSSHGHAPVREFPWCFVSLSPPLSLSLPNVLREGRVAFFVWQIRFLRPVCPKRQQSLVLAGTSHLSSPPWKNRPLPFCLMGRLGGKKGITWRIKSSCFMQTLHGEEHSCAQLEPVKNNYPVVELQWLDEAAPRSLPTFPVIQRWLPEHQGCIQEVTAWLHTG